MNDYKTLDHPPSPEELAEIYSQAEKSDPRSLFYQRTLIRPKLPAGRLTLFAILFASVSVIAYLGLFCTLHSWPVAALGALIAVVLVGLSVAKPLLITLVRSYQALASDKTRNRCRYEPSCSMYMLQAIEKYGFRRGFKKGLKRWKNCKPPNGGIDLP